MDGVEPQSVRTLLAPSSPVSKKQSKSPPSSPPRQQPRRRRIRSELDRLLSDEGTRNMLRAIKKSGKTQKPTAAGVFRSRVVVDTKNNKNKKKQQQQPPGKKKRPVIRGVVIRKQPKARERSVSLASSAGSNGNNATACSAGKMSDVKVDLSVVSVSRRGNVGFVTVACGGGGGGDDEVESRQDETGKETKRSRGVAGAFSVKVMQSVDASIRTFEQDSGVSVIVVQNSHSKYFCNGIDLQEVVSAATGSGSAGANKQPFSTIIKSIKSLISTLSSTRKVTVASIAGDCVGLGVMILPLFDFVYANDKSMFRVHYNALGQSPEGVGLLHNLMTGSGAGKISSLLYLNTPLTACEAQSAGLVSEILWPARYQEELLSRVQVLALNSSLATRTKAQVRNYKRALRIADLSSELSGIEGQWGGDAFLEKAKAFIENGGVVERIVGSVAVGKNIKIGGGSSESRKILLLNGGGASHVICNGGSSSSSCGG